MGTSGSGLQAASFVSSLLAERLASGQPLEQAETVRVQGALMLTDIEGWTARVQQLSGTGPEGLDELGRAMNSYAIDLAEIVYGYGGDVLAIAGDAFLCCWLARNSQGLGPASTLAAQAALAFQATEDRHSPSGRHMRTRIGIAAGDFEVAIVGGVNGRWELLPVGDPLDQVASAERRAPPGAVAVAASAWEHLSGFVRGVELDEAGLVVLTSPPVDLQRPRPSERILEVPPEALAPFVPAPVRGTLAVSGGEWLAELRPVTVVMVRLLDRSGSLAARIERTQLAVRTHQETIAQYEGASKPGTDNKGMTLSAVFGLPPRAHEDDAERALRAAAKLSERFAELGVPCSFGVASGRAFCGLFGSDLRREYTLHGDVTNLAARLAYASDGAILCDEVTAGAMSDRYSFQVLPPIAVRGRTEPVPIRRLQEIRPGPLARRAELIDRVDERALLVEQLRCLSERGERGAVVVEGDAGIGKSTLAAECARLAEQSGVRVLTAAADAVERATGYYAWRPLLAEVLGLDGDPPDAPTLERLLIDSVGAAPEAQRLLPLLSSVLPIAIPDNEVTATMTGDLRADNTTLLLTRILSRITASEPVLLVVEDAHWLDSSSWGLLAEVVRVVPRLLALITTRPIGVDSEAHEALTALGSGDPVRLSSLTPEHTAALVRQRLGVRAVPATLSRFIEDRVAGHPYFCEALVKTMQESGIVRVHDGRAVLGDFEGVDIPATVEGAVLSLVDRLTRHQQLSLKVAAVVGRAFSVRAVREAYPVSGERGSVPDDLRALEKLDLIELEPGASEPTYVFRHDIAREVTYKLLTESQLRPLHRAVAEWYERTHSPEELDLQSALLAYHWTRADDRARAVPYLENAGRGALRSGAFREAAQFYGQLTSGPAFEADDVSRRALWEKGEAAAHYFLGDLERSRRLLERAVARLDREVPRGNLSVARALARVGGRQVAHLLLPGRYHERRGSEKAILDEAVDCYKVLLQICYLDGEPTGELFYFMFAGLNVGEEAGPSPELARALANAAAVTSLFNLRGLADRYALRAERLAEQEGQSEALAYIWNLHALIQAQRGNWRRGIAASDRALELFGEIGDYNLEGELWQTRSALFICCGDFRGAEACWTRTRQIGDRNGNPQLECWSLLDEVQSRLGRGDLDAAVTALEAALAIETAPSDGSSTIEKHYSTAATRYQERRYEEALRAADQVIDMITSQAPTGFHWVDFAAGAVEVYVELLEQARGVDERAMLERRARRGCHALRRVAWSFHGVKARRWLLQGRLDWERGRRDQAERAWRKAESIADAMGMEYDLAVARLEIVRHGLAGVNRDALRAGSIETFERLGATRQLQRAVNC